jgi:hypothetical protein
LQEREYFSNQFLPSYHLVVRLGRFRCEAHSELGREMWNYARFVALAMSASAGMSDSALAADLGPPPAIDDDGSALNASDTREEA